MPRYVGGFFQEGSSWASLVRTLCGLSAADGDPSHSGLASCTPTIMRVGEREPAFAPPPGPAFFLSFYLRYDVPPTLPFIFLCVRVCVPTAVGLR